MFGPWLWVLVSVVVLAVLAAFVFGVVFTVIGNKSKDRQRRAGAVTSLSYGIDVIFGLMGSGKSFYAVQRLVNELLESRRPVYTNLPLRFRVVRAYLKIRGGPEVANLIHRLDERHWRAFLARQHQFATFREKLSKSSPAHLEPDRLHQYADANGVSVEQARTHTTFKDSRVAAWFNAINGEPILDGPDANWIPPTSLIVLDEVQHWHPMTKQKDDPSRENLLAYLTMIRHHLHALWVITQDHSRIAIEFRLLARYFWRVWDPSETRLAGPVRFKHVGLKCMAYECMTREQMENYERDKNDRPVEKFYIWPGGTKAKTIFRLYSSHTNIGSASEMMRQLRRTRQAAGLDENGYALTETAPMPEPPAKPSLARRAFRLVRKAAVLTTVTLVAYTAGKHAVPPQEQLSEQASQPAAPLAPLEWPRWTIAGASPVIGGRRIRQGEAISPRQVLDYVDPGGRKLVVRVDDAEWWLWDWPSPEPVRVGTLDDIRDSVQRLQQSVAAGGSVP